MARSQNRFRNEIPVAPTDPRGTQEMYQLPDGRSNGDVYAKGAWVLHSVRFLLGDDAAFFAALRAIPYPDPAAVPDGRQARFVGTADVVRAFTRAARRDLTPYFEAYLRHAEVLALVRDADGHLRWRSPTGSTQARSRCRSRLRPTGRSAASRCRGAVRRAGAVLDPNGRLLFATPS